MRISRQPKIKSIFKEAVIVLCNSLQWIVGCILSTDYTWAINSYVKIESNTPSFIVTESESTSDILKQSFLEII